MAGDMLPSPRSADHLSLFPFSSRSRSGGCQQQLGDTDTVGFYLLCVRRLSVRRYLHPGPFYSLSPGPISSILVNRYGSRPVVMFGGLLCGIGMVSAAFCTSILQLYICVGFITGKKKPSPFHLHLRFASEGLGCPRLGTSAKCSGKLGR